MSSSAIVFGLVGFALGSVAGYLLGSSSTEKRKEPVHAKSVAKERNDTPLEKFEGNYKMVRSTFNLPVLTLIGSRSEH